MRLLIVEDDALQADLLRQGLATAGFAVDTVSSGLAAVEIVQDRHYDAVLIDYNIPEIDGLGTARLLGDFLGPIARPVLIALTATPDRLTAREGGGESAFDLVLDKSCDLSAIIVAIARGLQSAPDIAAKRAAIDLIYDRAEADHFTGPHRLDEPGDDPGPVRILVVEDDALQRTLLAKILEKRGYLVETSANGLHAIRRIRAHCCDLAIVDYDLPEIDGLAVATLVHDQMAQAWRPRLIALTATPDVLRGRTMVSGPVFDHVVDKSCCLDDLLGAVDHLLRCSPNPDTRRAAAQVSPAERQAAFAPP